ncbi:DUF3006 domain-containing protein [Paenibacillus sp. GCM10028914]|uniref:DUF3006 domain-containing protein n=1 Tax=Paenibacillus sp. GCM10028914 TaxID=3273416 RepID=UPI0036D3F867
MKGIVDRLEGEYIVIEVEGKTIDVSTKKIAKDVKVGDVVILVDGLWRTDKHETEQRKAQITKLMKEVWEDEL